VQAVRPELRRKLLWMIAIRLGIITLFLGWAIVGELRAAPLGTSALFALLGITYALSALYAATVGFASRHGWAVDAQLAADALLVSAFVAVTGGVASYFSSLYVLPVIAAGVVHSRRSAVVIGLLAAALYTGLVVVQYTAPAAGPALYWLHSDAVDLPGARAAVYTVALNVFGLLAVASLIGSLAERLAVADASLARASTELAHLQAVNQDVIDSLTSGLVTTDYAGRVLTCNRAAEAITGQAAATVAGRQAGEVLQLPGSLVASLQRDLDGARSWREEFAYRTGDDRVIEIGLSVVHLVTPTGRAGFLFNFQDISHVRKMQRDAQMQNRLAAVGEMAAGIAHEIRNPLASISGSVQILRQELHLNEEQRELMDIVLRESERLNQTIRGFLAYARPQRFQVKRLDLGSLLRDAALLLGNSAEVRPGHRIVVEAPSSEVAYEADEGQIRQIIWNLATNGLKAMPDGGRLRLAARQEPSRDTGGAPIGGTGDAVLVVEDEGIGIAPEELDLIFQPFHGSFAGGSGLGLSIVHRIVRDYDGEVQVTSAPGAGTTVLVRLPARTPVVAA
jgi:two-component system sensor histidine kinase PilS (NtrC family)